MNNEILGIEVLSNHFNKLFKAKRKLLNPEFSEKKELFEQASRASIQNLAYLKKKMIN